MPWKLCGLVREQIVLDSLRCPAAVCDRFYRCRRTKYRIAAGKYAVELRRERELIHADCAAFRNRWSADGGDRFLADCSNDLHRRNLNEPALYRHRPPATAVVKFPQLHLLQFDSYHGLIAVTDDLDRSDEKLELHALLKSLGDFLGLNRHFFARSAVGNRHVFCTQP